MKDRIVEEVRSVRRKLDKVIEGDPKKFAAQIELIRKKYQKRLVTIGPKLRKKNAA